MVCLGWVLDHPTQSGRYNLEHCKHENKISSDGLNCMSWGLMFLSMLSPTNLCVGNDDRVGAYGSLGPKISLNERSDEELALSLSQ